MYIEQQAFAKQILLSACCQQFKTVHIATGICQTDTAVCLLSAVQDCTYSNRHLSNRYCSLLAVRSLKMYIRQQAFAKQILLSACCQQFKTVHTAADICQTDTAVCLLVSRQQYLFGCCMYSLELPMMHRRSSETCRVSFQNKIIDTLVHLIDFTVEIKILS